MKNGDHPLGDKDPRNLSDREWRVLMSYRMEQLEHRVDGLFKAMWTIAGTIIAGVAIFFLTSGRHATSAALQWIGFG